MRANVSLCIHNAAIVSSSTHNVDSIRLRKRKLVRQAVLFYAAAVAVGKQAVNTLFSITHTYIFVVTKHIFIATEHCSKVCKKLGVALRGKYVSLSSNITLKSSKHQYNLFSLKVLATKQYVASKRFADMRSANLIPF